jgi:hypothetical protein
MLLFQAFNGKNVFTGGVALFWRHIVRVYVFQWATAELHSEF